MQQSGLRVRFWQRQVKMDQWTKNGEKINLRFTSIGIEMNQRFEFSEAIGFQTDLKFSRGVMIDGERKIRFGQRMAQIERNDLFKRDARVDPRVQLNRLRLIRRQRA